MSSNLVLEFSDIDGKYHINDENGFAFGDGQEIPEAIQSARIVTDEPIYFGDSFCGIPRVMVTEKPTEAIADCEPFIAALAEIAGMKVTKYFDDNMHFLGYGMELIEWTPHLLFL